MKKIIKGFPWFYLLFTFYPLLFLWAMNISQIDPIVVIRPFLFTLFGSVVLYALIYMIFRDLVKAGLVGFLFLLAFFSYGHVYYWTRSVPFLKILNHHTILAPLYLVLLGLATWGVLRIKKVGNLVRYLNLLGLFLVLLQVGELSYAYIRSSYADSRPVKVQSSLSLTTAPRNMPDIYVIVLDTYMRSDALKQDLGYDNSAFLDQLTQMGFYVANCSRPNYIFTYASISALLNMRYIPGAYANDVWSQFSDSGFWSILKNDEVRQQLKSVGYKTVAFQEDYPLLQFDDSDVLIGTNHPTINSSYLYPFEVLYKQSTAAIILNALDPNGRIARYFQHESGSQGQSSVDLSGLKGPNKDLVATHVISTQFILDHLTDVLDIAGPKFTYVHLFIPHYPYIFGPDGQIMTDPGYYSGDRGSAVDSYYENTGYVNQVGYIDKRMIPILQQILRGSKNPPIILLMGDHGLNDATRQTNLMAYYLPGDGKSRLYPSITPVNSFRLIFDEYFGANYPLLPDETYISDNRTAPDPYPGCSP
jgi:hypothetical protein